MVQKGEKSESKVLENLFLRDKPARILSGLKVTRGPIYVTVLSKEANCTYSHTIKILDAFLDLGIVKFEKKGRIKKVTLTDDGWSIARCMESLQKEFTKVEDGIAKTTKK